MALKNIYQQPNAYDIWQYKILDAALNRTKPTTTTNMLLSIENLKSLIQRLTTHMEQLSYNHSDLLKQFLFSSNIAYLQECVPKHLQHISALITFYNLPINILNCCDLSDGTDGSLNYLRMLMEFQKFNLNPSTIHCISRILQS